MGNTVPIHNPPAYSVHQLFLILSTAHSDMEPKMENFKLGKTITLSFLILASSWQGTDQLLHQTYSLTPNYIQDGISLAHYMEEQMEILIIAITRLR